MGVWTKGLSMNEIQNQAAVLWNNVSMGRVLKKRLTKA
jgi:hypothetical protein